MTTLIIYCAAFVLIHILVSGTAVRGRLIGMLGDKLYLPLYSLASVVLLVLAVLAYNKAPMVVLWEPWPGLHWLAALVMVLAFLLLPLGYLARNPTSMGKEANIHNAEAVRGVLRITRHPVLNAIGLWALTHMLFNGDVASQVFFGAMLLTCAAGMPSIDAKLAQQFGEEWQRFAAQTSRLPFAAILAGRNTLALRELNVWGLLAGVVLFVGFVTFHGRLFGAPLF